MYWDSGNGDTFFSVLTSSTLGALSWTKDNSHLPELIPGVYYQFKVSAINSIGESDLSPAISIVAATYPDPPSQPTATNTDKTSITIAWTVTYDGGASIDDFQVDWKL